MAIHDLTTLTDELKKYEVERLVLHPELWSKLHLSVTLNWKAKRFNKMTAQSVPRDYGGVYAFVVKPSIAAFSHASYLLYIGRTQGKEGFYQRYRNYLAQSTEKKNRRPTLRQMFDKWPNHLWFCFARLDLHGQKLNAVESALLKAFLPPFNRQFPGVIGKARKAWQ
jgi:hypothetical protein